MEDRVCAYLTKIELSPRCFPSGAMMGPLGREGAIPFQVPSFAKLILSSVSGGGGGPTALAPLWACHSGPLRDDV